MSYFVPESQFNDKQYEVNQDVLTIPETQMGNKHDQVYMFYR